MLAGNCGIKIYLDSEFEVWMGPSDDLEADNIINAHIVGYGSTKEAALAMAVAELESVVKSLQETPDLPVTDIRRTA